MKRQIIVSIFIPNQLTSEDCNLRVGYFDTSNRKLNQWNMLIERIYKSPAVHCVLELFDRKITPSLVY